MVIAKFHAQQIVKVIFQGKDYITFYTFLNISNVCLLSYITMNAKNIKRSFGYIIYRKYKIDKISL